MPRGSSRIFRTKMDGAAADLGISGGVENRLVDSVFRQKAAGAYKAQGFSVDGPNVSREFQGDADLAISELGLSPFTAQSISINIPVNNSNDKLFNNTEQAIGIENTWSIGVWWKPAVVPFGTTEFLFDLRRTNAPAAASQISLYHDASNARLRLDWADTSGSPVEVTAWNGIYTGEAGNWVHILIAWVGGTMFLLKNGVDQGAPDVGVNNPSLIMADDARKMAFGSFAIASAGGSIEGNIAQAGMWNADVRAAALQLVVSGSSANLNADSAAYVFSGNLAHWYRAGNEAEPTIGRDYSEAGFTPTISLDTDSDGIVNADRQLDVP